MSRTTRVPANKVLLTRCIDSFTNEIFITSWDAGDEVTVIDWDTGIVIDDGKSLEIVETIRNDAPGEAWDHTNIKSRITNNKGKAEKVELGRCLK